MLSEPKLLAPEPYFSAYLELLDRIIIQARSIYLGETRIPDEQMLDLLEAIHNIPSMVLEYRNGGSGYDEGDIRKYFLEEYDAKWAKEENAFSMSLVTALEDSIRCVNNRDSANTE